MSYKALWKRILPAKTSALGHLKDLLQMICCSFWGSKGRDDLTPTFVQAKHGTIWIAFVQGQDITKPDFEQSGINALKQNMLPPSGVVCFNVFLGTSPRLCFLFFTLDCAHKKIIRKFY